MLDEKICPCCGKNTMFPWDTMCYSCRKEKYHLDMKASINEGKTETYREDSVYCPYCGETIDCHDVDNSDDVFFNEGEDDIDCPHCGKTFHLETEIEYKYSTSRSEEDDDDENEEDEE